MESTATRTAAFMSVTTKALGESSGAVDGRPQLAAVIRVRGKPSTRYDTNSGPSSSAARAATASYPSAALVRERLGDADRETRWLAMLDALDALHRIGPDRAVMVAKAPGGFRAVLVDFDARPDAGAGVTTAAATPLPTRIESTTEAEAVVAIFTSDGRYLERPVRTTPTDMTSTWSELSLPASLLARAVSSGWRLPMPAAGAQVASASQSSASLSHALEPALPGIQATFLRFVLRFVYERLQATGELAESEKALWGSGAAQRLAFILEELPRAEGNLPQVIVDLETARTAAIDSLRGDSYALDSATASADRYALERATASIDQQLQEAHSRLKVTRAQIMFGASQGRGAAGFIQPEDVYSNVALRTPHSLTDATTKVLARLNKVSADVGKHVLAVGAALKAGDRDEPAKLLEADLLAVKPVVEVAFICGFGAQPGQYDDAFQCAEARHVFAPVPTQALASMHTDLLSQHPTNSLDVVQSQTLVGSIAVSVVTLGVGALTVSFWPVLAGTALAWAFDGYEIWELAHALGARSELAYAVTGLPGYRDQDLELDLAISVASFALSSAIDVRETREAWRKFFATGSVAQQVSRAPWLNNLKGRLDRESGVGWKKDAAQLLANAIQGAQKRVRFADAAEARGWVIGLESAFDERPLAAARTYLREQIEQHGSWHEVVKSFDALGIDRTTLYRVRDRALADVKQRLGTQPHVSWLAPDSAGQLEVVIDTVSTLTTTVGSAAAVRTQLATDFGPEWERVLGLRRFVRIAPGHLELVAQHLLNACGSSPGAFLSPRAWTSIASVPRGACKGFVNAMNELGGWNAVSKQFAGTNLPATIELNRIRNELYGFLDQHFLARSSGTSDFLSDLDVSVMHAVGQPGIRARTEALDAFMLHIADLPSGASRAWKGAFNMEAFADPILATIYERLRDRGTALVLGQHVFERAAVLTKLSVRAGQDPLVGYHLLAEYARKHPFPADLLQLGAAGSNAQLRNALATKMDEALAQLDALLASSPPNKLDVLKRAKRVSDVALAQALANEEAYFLAGATKTVMILRGNAAPILFRNIDPSLAALRRVFVEELQHTLDENWFIHVLHDLQKVLGPEWDALPLAEQKKQLAKAFFQIGKYGHQRAAGFFLLKVEHDGALMTIAESLGASPALQRKLEQLNNRLGQQLKGLRDAAEPTAILDVVSRSRPDVLEVLERKRALDAMSLPPSELGTAGQQLLTAASSQQQAVTRARGALQVLVDELIGPGSVHSSTLTYPVGSVLGDLQRLVARASAGERPALDRWLLERLSLNAGKVFARGLVDSDDDDDELDPQGLGARRTLGAFAPPGEVWGAVDREFMCADGPWSPAIP